MIRAAMMAAFAPCCAAADAAISRLSPLLARRRWLFLRRRGAYVTQSHSGAYAALPATASAH